MGRLRRYIAAGMSGLLLFGTALLALPLPASAADHIVMLKVETDPTKVPLCLEFKKILELPQNKNLIIDVNGYDAFKAKFEGDGFTNFLINRKTPIYIPSSFTNFTWPAWAPVSSDEAKAKLGYFIDEIVRSQRQRFNIDYTFVKTSMDIDGDDKPDVIYQQKGGSHTLLVEKNDSPLSKSFNQMINLLSHGDIIFYGGNPYVITNELEEVGIMKMVATAPPLQDAAKQICTYRKLERK